MNEGPELRWRLAYFVGTCVSCRRSGRGDKVLVISPRHNGGFEMRMCRKCVEEIKQMVRDLEEVK